MILLRIVYDIERESDEMFMILMGGGSVIKLWGWRKLLLHLFKMFLNVFVFDLIVLSPVIIYMIVYEM